MKKTEKQDEARRLRRDGVSVRNIAKMIGVSKSSVSLWVRDILLTEVQKANLGVKRDPKEAHRARSTKALDRRKANRELGRKVAGADSRLHRMGCMLYWAEGAKSTNDMSFTNTDSAMVALFFRFLKEECVPHIEDVKLRFCLHLHDPSLKNEAFEYWRGVLEEDVDISLVIVDTSNFKKKPKIVRNNKHPMGCLHIRANSTALQQYLLGGIEGYVGCDLFTFDPCAKRKNGGDR